MSDDSLIEGVRMMHDAMQDSLRTQYEVDESWVMKDIPWLTQEYYGMLFDAIGEENYHFVSGSSMSGDKVVRLRATILINEQGLANIKKLAEEIHT